MKPKKIKVQTAWTESTVLPGTPVSGCKIITSSPAWNFSPIPITVDNNKLYSKTPSDIDTNSRKEFQTDLTDPQTPLTDLTRSKSLELPDDESSTEEDSTDIIETFGASFTVGSPLEEPMTKGRFLQNQLKLLNELEEAGGNTTYIAKYLEQIESLAEQFDTTMSSGYSTTRDSVLEESLTDILANIHRSRVKSTTKPVLSPLKQILQKQTPLMSELSRLVEQLSIGENSLQKHCEPISVAEKTNKETMEVRTRLLLLVEMLEIPPYDYMLLDHTNKCIIDILQHFEAMFKEKSIIEIIPTNSYSSSSLSFSTSIDTSVTSYSGESGLEQQKPLVNYFTLNESNSNDSSSSSDFYIPLTEKIVKIDEYIAMIDSLILTLETNHQEFIDASQDEGLKNALNVMVLRIFDPSIVIQRR